MLCNERLLQVYDLVETDVRVEVCLDLVENHDRAVGTSSAAVHMRLASKYHSCKGRLVLPELALGLKSGRNSNGIVENTVLI